ncbi:MAG: hypothetical protein AAGD10_16145 [Myxococcota bacterium]
MRPVARLVPTLLLAACGGSEDLQDSGQVLASLCQTICEFNSRCGNSISNCVSTCVAEDGSTFSRFGGACNEAVANVDSCFSSAACTQEGVAGCASAINGAAIGCGLEETPFTDGGEIDLQDQTSRSLEAETPVRFLLRAPAGSIVELATRDLGGDASCDATDTLVTVVLGEEILARNDDNGSSFCSLLQFQMPNEAVSIEIVEFFGDSVRFGLSVSR